MIQINQDTSQWATLTILLGLLNERGIKLKPLIVDIGAHHPKEISNSWPFINELNWRAILVEPNPDSFKQINEYYKDNNRVKVVEVALYKEEGYAKLKLTDGCSGYGSLINNKHAASQQQKVYEIEVETITPKQLIDRYKIKDVGLLTVDVEGLDTIILSEWMNNSEVRPQVIITESSIWDNGKEEMLKGYGYEKIGEAGENELFLYGDKLC